MFSHVFMSLGYHLTSSGVVKGHTAPWLLCFHVPCVNMLTNQKAAFEKIKHTTEDQAPEGLKWTTLVSFTYQKC